MRGIRIINPGLYSTIQDNGRTGFREFGLPVSGAMDIYSFHHANWLVRNDINEAVIETTFPGIEIEFMSPTIFAVTGGDMFPELNGKRIMSWKSYRAKPGARLALTRLVNGARSYISFSGGFRIDSELNSLSTYVKGKLGGYRGRELRKGDIIPLFPGLPYLFNKRKVPDNRIPEFKDSVDLRVLRGVNYDYFSPSSINKFLKQKFIVSSKSDRMGLRLEGNNIEALDKRQIISYGIGPGAIQVPGDGNPIIMGMDCQTVGGYPQIANILTSDIPLLGQLKPGDQIRFRISSMEEALELIKIYDSKIMQLFGNKGSVCTDCIEKRR